MTEIGTCVLSSGARVKLSLGRGTKDHVWYYREGSSLVWLALCNWQHQNNTMHQTVDPVRDWSLITGRRGATKPEVGRNVKFTPTEKGGGGAEQVLAMLKGGRGT